MALQTCLGVACSPRKNGNTGILMRTALDTLGSLGVETKAVYLADLEILPCLACDGCHREGRCVLKDGAGPLYEQLLKADMIVLAAPIFSLGLCAQAKAFIDRAQQFWATRYILRRPVIEDEIFRKSRRGIFISVAGSNLPGVFDGALQVAGYFFKMIDFRLAGAYCYPGVDKKGEILSHGPALQEIREAAAKMAAAEA